MRPLPCADTRATPPAVPRCQRACPASARSPTACRYPTQSLMALMLTYLDMSAIAHPCPLCTVQPIAPLTTRTKDGGPLKAQSCEAGSARHKLHHHPCPVPCNMCHCHLERRAGEEVHKEYMWYKGYAVLGVGVDGGGGAGAGTRALGVAGEVRASTQQTCPPCVSRISKQYMTYAIYEMQYNT